MLPDLCGSGKGVERFDGGFDSCRHFIGVAEGKAGGGNELADSHFEGLALDVVGVHGQEVEGVHERNGHDIGLRFDGEEKSAGEKRLNDAIGGAATLGKNDEWCSAAQAAESGLDGADRSGWILLVDTDLPGAFEVPADERVGKQFTFENNAELEREVDVKDRNIQGGGVGDGVDAGLGVVKSMGCGASDFDGRQDRLHDQPRPEASEFMLQAATAIEQGAGEGDAAEEDGVGPDKRINDEVGTEMAEPAVAGLRGNSGLHRRPSGRGGVARRWREQFRSFFV